MSSECELSNETLLNIGLKITEKTENDLELLLNSKTASKLEKIEIISTKDLISFFELESHAIEIYLRIIKDITGTISFVFPRSAAFNLVNLLLLENNSKEEYFSKMGISALKETCNIFAGSIVNDLANALQVNPILSVPSIAFVTSKSIMKLTLTGLKNAQKAVVAKMSFSIKSKTIECCMILLIDLTAIKSLANLA